MVEALEIATEQIKEDEGLSLMPYDCTAGVLTIGYGRAIGLNGITEDEAETLLKNDVAIAANDARQYLGDTAFEALNAERQAVLINMAFNLGLSRLRQFVKLKAAILEADWDEAAAQMLSSKWSSQVGARSVRLAAIMCAD